METEIEEKESLKKKSKKKRNIIILLIILLLFLINGVLFLREYYKGVQAREGQLTGTIGTIPGLTPEEL